MKLFLYSVAIVITTSFMTMYASDTDVVEFDDDVAISDSDTTESDDDIALSDEDVSEPHYDDYNFPDVPESTDENSVKTERIIADGCTLLFL